MSKQQRQHDSESDPVVSQAYRELARERTPAHLDHVVLNHARSAAKTSRRREISWLRPAAWVTTIGLCLAIVLEFTDPVPRHDAPATRAPTTEHKESRGDAPALRRERAEPQEIVPARALSLDRDAADVADGPVPGAVGLEAEQAMPGTPSDEFKNEKSVPSDVQYLEHGELMMLQEVDRRARMQETAAGTAFKPLRKTMSLAETGDERYCDEQETSTPESWVECIMRLQQEGRYDAARLEHERLQETYPGADIPPLTAPLPDSP